jgi:hypothetical protein
MKYNAKCFKLTEKTYSTFLNKIVDSKNPSLPPLFSQKIRRDLCFYLALKENIYTLLLLTPIMIWVLHGGPQIGLGNNHDCPFIGGSVVKIIPGGFCLFVWLIMLIDIFSLSLSPSNVW